MMPTGLLLVALSCSTLGGAHEFVYTFWTPGRVHVYLPAPEEARAASFFIYDITGEDPPRAQGVTEGDGPFTTTLGSGYYRLEADEELAVVVGDRADPGCANLFVQPTPGDGC